MAEIEFERRGFPLWKALVGLLALGAAGFGGYEMMHHDAVLAPPAAMPAAERPRPPAGARPSSRPATTQVPGPGSAP